MADETYINAGGIVMNSRAKLIMKRGSGAAIGLLAITGNHMSIPGMRIIDVTNAVKDKYDVNHEYDKDIVVNEDVWIGARVTLLAGVNVGTRFNNCGRSCCKQRCSALFGCRRCAC